MFNKIEFALFIKLFVIIAFIGFSREFEPVY